MKAISLSDYSPIHAMVMLLLIYRSVKSTLGYDTVIWCTWVMAAGRNFAFEIAAKSLQIETSLPLTSSSPYRS